jgi:hypothetical protein
VVFLLIRCEHPGCQALLGATGWRQRSDVAGYWPLTLSSAARTAIIGGRTSYVDRRRAAVERLSITTEITDSLEVLIDRPFPVLPSRSEIEIAAGLATLLWSNQVGANQIGFGRVEPSRVGSR